jgi:hypothetical protein
MPAWGAVRGVGLALAAIGRRLYRLAAFCETVFLIYEPPFHFRNLSI